MRSDSESFQQVVEKMDSIRMVGSAYLSLDRWGAGPVIASPGAELCT